MAKSSEDVLLMVGHVRYKKADGTLYVMDKRLGWMPDGRDSFAMSYMYQDIKMQKISAEGKSKIQLQVVLNDGTSTTFHFVNPHGVDTQKSDRDSVKELLQQLLPKFKRKPSKELQEKNKFLTENPQLLHLYKELVITQVITSEEFWSQYVNHNNNNGNSVPTPKDTAVPLKQNIGVPSAFLAEIRPQTDGCNGLRYNLTTDTIEAIFRTYPAVRKKHLEHVPHKMTEQEFWTRFFQSHYYHRDRTNYASKEMFADCAKTDEQEIANAVKKVSDPLLDLSQMKDTSLEEGYGSSSSIGGPSQASNHITHTAIIRRFNHHSTRVLQACDEKQEESNDHSSVENGALEAKRRKLAEKLEYEDLEERPQMRGAAMTLAKADRYRHGPTVAVEQVNDEVVCDNWNKISWCASRWEPRLSSCLNPSLAVSVLGELSPNGILMKSNCDTPFSALPQSVGPELCQLYVCAQELLRHFWCTFPPTTPQLQQKAVRMRDTLERFHNVKVRHLEERLHREIGSSECLTHLQQLLHNAMEKFNTWQQRNQISAIR